MVVPVLVVVDCFLSEVRVFERDSKKLLSFLSSCQNVHG